MAKASWLNIQPEQGSGNGSVIVSTPNEHTGRSARETDITFKAPNVDPVMRKVIQAGKPEFAEFSSKNQTIPKEGGTVAIRGVSNSPSLTFSLGTGHPFGMGVIPNTYTVNGKNVENGAVIPGDPGDSAQFMFNINILLPENDTFTEKTGQLLVKPLVGKAQICTLTLAADSPYLTVADGDILLSYTGDSVSVDVSSNTDWYVE